LLLNLRGGKFECDCGLCNASRWSAIATHLPGRTDNEIKNYWNTHLKKRLMQMGIDPVTHKAATAHDLGLLDVSGTDVKPLLSATLSHMSQWDRVRAETEARLSSNIINSSNNLSSFNKSSLSQVMSSSNFGMAPSSEMKFCSSSSSSAGDVFNRSWKTQVTDMLRESFELAAARLNPLMDQPNYQKVLQDWETSSLQQQCQNSLGGQGDLMYDPESSANSASSLSLQEYHHHSPSAGHGGSCTPISSSSPTNNIFMAMSPTSTLSPLEHFLQPPPLRLPFSEFSLPCQPSTSEEGSALAFNTCSSESHASDSKLEEFWQSTQQAGDLQIAATTVLSSTANFELREPGLLPPDFFLDSGASLHGALVVQEILSSSSSTSFVVDNILTENLQDFQQTFQSCRVQTANVGASHCAPFITPVGRI
jgi:hypothetical protein